MFQYPIIMDFLEHPTFRLKQSCQSMDHPHQNQDLDLGNLATVQSLSASNYTVIALQMESFAIVAIVPTVLTIWIMKLSGLKQLRHVSTEIQKHLSRRLEKVKKVNLTDDIVKDATARGQGA